MNPVIDFIKNHRSIRQFSAKPVGDEIVKTIIEAAGWASTSNFIQAYTVIRVTDKDNRKELASLAGPQPWVETCPIFLVFCADLKRAENACLHENTEIVSGFTEQFIIATVDVSLFAQNAMIAAESLGLGGVFIGGLRNDPQKVCELLNIPDHVYPVFGLCLGYPEGESEQKPRLPVNVVLKKETYQEDEAVLLQYNDICREYYENRSSGARDETWTRQIANMVSQPARPHMRLFLENRGFEFK
jgi:FMN reductase (NADPH)